MVCADLYLIGFYGLNSNLMSICVFMHCSIN